MSLSADIKYRIQRVLRTQRVLAGIQDGSQAFIGPELVTLDITNICRNKCLACWIHSPYLKGEMERDPVFRKQLSIDVLERVIRDCSRLKVRHIILSGGGNVFIHPHFNRVIQLIREAGILVTINANFVDCRPEQAQLMVDAGVDSIIASVWAASPEVYVKTHPDKKEEDFFRMTEMVKQAAKIRNNGGQFTVFNVILNKNYHELFDMANYAAAVGATHVDFCLVDPVPGKTDCLLLNETELAETRRQAVALENEMRIFAQKGLQFKDFDLFKSRLNAQNADCGQYNQVLKNFNQCHIGWNFLRINADGSVNSCLKSWRFCLGNVNKESLISIWNNTPQQDFRSKGQSLSANHDFFGKMGNNPNPNESGCFLSCDNQGIVTDTREMLLRMPSWRKKLAALMTPYYKRTIF